MTLEKTSNLIIFYLLISLPLFFLIGSFFVNFITILISLYSLCWIIIYKKYNLILSKSYILFLPLFILFLISSFFSDYKVTAFEESFSYLSQILFFISLPIILLTNDKKKLLISKIIFFIVILICIDLWFQKFFHINITGYTTQQAGRLTSFFKEEQVPGSIIFKMSPFVIYFLFCQKQNKILFKYKFYIILFIYFSILITGERSASILSTLLIIFLTVSNLKTINKKKFFYYFSFFFIIFFILINSKNSVIKERILYTVNNQIYDNVYLTFYKNSYLIFSNNILLGTGPQSYRYVCPNNSYIDKDPNNACSTHPHNYFFELLSDAGIFAPLFFIYSLFFIIRKKIKAIKNIFLKSIIISYTILFFFPLIPTGSFFTSFHMTLTWFSLGFLYSLKKLK